MSNPADPLSPEVRDALKRGNLVEAIKLLRNASGIGLAEAKALLESQHQTEQQPKVSVASALQSPDVLDALRAGNKILAIKLVRARTGLGLKDAKDAVDSAHVPLSAALPNGLSPGEMPRTGGKSWWWLVLIGVVLLAGYFLR